jgi:hypothetical protein
VARKKPTNKKGKLMDQQTAQAISDWMHSENLCPCPQSSGYDQSKVGDAPKCIATDKAMSLTNHLGAANLLRT